LEPTKLTVLEEGVGKLGKFGRRGKMEKSHRHAEKGRKNLD
jgi:hypothetical protein